MQNLIVFSIFLKLTGNTANQEALFFLLPLKIENIAKSASGGFGTLESTAHASKLFTNRALAYILARFVESLLACAVLSRVPKPPEALFATSPDELQIRSP